MERPGIRGQRQFWPPVDAAWVGEALRLLRTLPRDQQETKNQTSDGLFPVIYDQLISHLESRGYVLNVNFWIHTYDWTQSNRYSGEKLAELIETIKKETGKESAVGLRGHGRFDVTKKLKKLLVSMTPKRSLFVLCPTAQVVDVGAFLHAEAENERQLRGGSPTRSQAASSAHGQFPKTVRPRFESWRGRQ